MTRTGKSILSAVLFLLVLSVMQTSDGTAATFETWYGTDRVEYLFAVIEASDGNFVVAGYGDTDDSILYAHLAKLDATGDTLWTKRYNASSWQFVQSLVELDDSSLVVVGGFAYDGQSRGYVIKTDAQGDTIWTKLVAEDSYSRIEKVRLASDGSLLLAGIKHNAISPTSSMDVFMLRLDENGDTLSSNLYGGLGDDMCSDILELSTGEYIIVGVTTPPPAAMLKTKSPSLPTLLSSLKAPLFDEYDPYGHIYFLDSGRSVVWEDTISNAGWGKWSVEEIGDHEVILTGVVNTAPLNADIFLSRIDASPGGGVEWMRTINWPEDDDSRAIAKFSNDLFLVVGNTKSLDPAGDYDGDVVLLDIHGDTLYTKLYDDDDDWEELSSICMTGDGDFISVGGSVNPGGGPYDAYVIKDSVPSLAAFKASATSGDAPLTVQFNDISTFTPTSWEWDFDDNGTVDSYSQNPSFEYTNPGIYSVELVASDGVTNYSRVKSEFIVVGDTIFFTASPTEGYNPLTVYFNDHSGGDPTAWEWDFNNDGTVDSYEQNPIHTYDTIGVYSVKLEVWYGEESQVLIQSDYITIDLKILTVKPDGTGDFPTIQGAINNSYDGWIIELTDGVFTGEGNRELVMGGRQLTVRSQSDDPEACIIDCEGAARGFSIYEYEGLECNVVIRGITIRNGYIDVDALGGGIQCFASEPSIINCHLVNNYASESGGGIGCFDCSPTISECVFIGNESGDKGGGLYIVEDHVAETDPVDVSGCEFIDNVAIDGGGLYLWNYVGEVTDCSFSGNSASYGGGIWGGNNSEIVLTGCRITENTVSDDGGGLHFNGWDLVLNDCLVSGNNAISAGGGCYIVTNTLLITGCTVVADSAGTGLAGGLEIIASSALVDNTLIAFNGGLGIFGPPGMSISCSDIFGNEDGDWTGSITDQLGTNGNISEDPLFCDLSGNIYTLRDGSPCLPAANPSCGLIGVDTVGCIEAQFTADPTRGLAPVTVQFTDLTPGSPDAWAWDFQNDGIVDSTSQNPSFEYQEGGAHSVSLKTYLAGELIASTVKHDLIDLMDGNNVLIEPMEILSQDTLPLPIVYLGSEPWARSRFISTTMIQNSNSSG